MRAPAILAALAVSASALIAGPAQASGGTLNVAWDASAQEFVITATAGIGPFGEAEELVVAGGRGQLITGIIDGDHTFTYGRLCTRVEVNDNQRAICLAPPGVTKTHVRIDMRAATGATTTAVAPPEFKNDPVTINFLGGSGPDYVQGGEGNDEIYGGAGDDDLFGGLGDDKVGGDEGNDDVWGEEGNDSVGGGPGNDNVTGDEGVDSIIGGSGVDSLDSEDGIKDAYVDCDNEPGLGAILFDRGLDLPYDCPVLLPPTQPRDITVDPGSNSFTVSWKPSEFDGNDPYMSYELRLRTPGDAEWSPAVAIPGTDTSYTRTDLAKQGLHSVSMRAIGSGGDSAWTPALPFTVGARPAAPDAIESIFTAKWNATVSWLPVSGSDIEYELGLRVRDRDNRNWLAWTTLPTLYNTNAAVQVGDDLRVVNGRIYQFRVRAIRGESTSDWTVSAQRFAGNFEPLKGASLIKTSQGVVAELTIPGLAWRYNTVGSDGLLAAQYGPKGARSVNLPLTPRTPESVLKVLPGSPDKGFRDCWVGLVYKMPGASTNSVARVSTACPK